MSSPRLACILFALSLLVSVSGRATTAPDRPRLRVLIVDGFSNHHWQLTTTLLREIFDADGRFETDVSTAPPTAASPGWDTWRPRFSRYDVVVQTCNDIGGGPSWPDPVRRDFETYVREGGGVFIYHSANNAFPDWPAYNRIIGLGWRKASQGIALAVADDGGLIRIPAGQGRDTGHGPRVDAVITRLGDHLIHNGLPRTWKTPDIEIYHHIRGPAEDVSVLSYARDPVTGMNWPIEWTVAYGRGRVYSATYGHVWRDDTRPDRMRCAAVQTLMVRALFWLAGRTDQSPAPADFPTAHACSIREVPPQVSTPTPAGP